MTEKTITPIICEQPLVFNHSDEFYNSFVSAISLRRKELKMSQRDLSRKSGIPQKTISHIESGIGKPKLNTLHSLTEVLGMQIEINLSVK